MSSHCGWRWGWGALLFVAASGCNSWPGSSTKIPPPGTGSYQQPNTYYQQPPATPPFTAPNYGAPAGSTTIAPPPGFGQTSGGAAGAVSFAPQNNWQPVKQPATIQNGTIQPRSTLTTVRGTNTPVTAEPSATTAARSTGLTDISQLPLVPVPPVGSAAPGTAVPTYPPAYPPAGYPGTAARRDPWLGR